VRITTNQVTEFVCEICLSKYSTKESAELCESRPVTEDRGVKVGDVVRIRTGEGEGHFAKVTRLHIIDKDWGHYYANRYWHTVAVTADLIDGWGTRTLTFDSYERPT
jgi:hypothetical protein